MLANLPRMCQSQSKQVQAGGRRLFRVSADPPASQHKANSGDQFLGRVTQDKIRAGNFRRMEAHLQNWQTRIIVVNGVGHLALFHSPETMADQSQIHLFNLAQSLNLSQSQRRTDGEAFMFQQQLPSCLESFIRGNRQYFGHELFGLEIEL
jgi:hypothetical protein